MPRLFRLEILYFRPQAGRYTSRRSGFQRFPMGLWRFETGRLTYPPVRYSPTTPMARTTRSVWTAPASAALLPAAKKPAKGFAAKERKNRKDFNRRSTLNRRLPENVEACFQPRFGRGNFHSHLRSPRCPTPNSAAGAGCILTLSLGRYGWPNLPFGPDRRDALSYLGGGAAA